MSVNRAEVSVYKCQLSIFISISFNKVYSFITFITFIITDDVLLHEQQNTG